MHGDSDCNNTLAPLAKGPGLTVSDGHVKVLDAVRGFAALAVVYLHCREISWIGMRSFWKVNGFDLSISSILAYATFPIAYGAIGVPILFVVSGYVIHRQSLKQISAGLTKFSSSRFLLRRFIRIYPTFLAAIFVTFVCDRVTSSLVEHPKLGDTSLWALFSNIVALQGILARPFGSNGPLWSLAVEIQFYAIYPIMLAIRLRVGSLPMMLISVFISIVGALTLEPNITAFPQYYFAWWLGAFIADQEDENHLLPFWWQGIPCTFIPLGCYFAATQFPFIAFVCWAIGVAPVVAWLVTIKTAASMVEIVLRNVGYFSYSIYAAHLPVIVLINAIFFSNVHPARIEWSFLILSMTIGVCYLFFLIAERPFIILLSEMKR